MTHDEVRTLLKRELGAQRIYHIGSYGLRSWCRDKGVRNPGPVSEFLRGKRSPPPEMLDALGLEYVIRRKP